MRVVSQFVNIAGAVWLIAYALMILMSQRPPLVGGKSKDAKENIDGHDLD